MTNLSGATTAVFVISLSAALETPVTVDWQTKDGTAKAGKDYEAANGTVTFEPGETSRQIQVIVYGREEGDNATRTFGINLYPPENAILDQTLTEVEIQVTDLEGIVVTSIVVATGPRGVKGDPGLSAYELAKLQGYQGTLSDWINSQNPAAALFGKTLRAPEYIQELPSMQELEGKILGFINGKPAGLVPESGSAADVMIQMAKEDGTEKIGFKLNYTTAVVRTLYDRLKDRISVKDFGAKGDGEQDDYPAFQYAAMYAESIGGAIIEIPTPAVEYKIGFPVYLFNNTHFKGSGINCRINFTDPLYARKSRSGFVMGSGREQNRDKAIQCLTNGTWSTTGSVVDSTFVELARGVYLRDNLDKVQSSNCCVSDVYLVASYPNGTTLKGGYGVSFANAIDCEAYNIWGEGWTEIINIGSDVPPATPSCHNCHAYNIVSIEPNNYETYYSVGFIANSTACTIHDYFQLKPIADGSPHGSGASMNYTEDCAFYNFYIPNLGRTATSEGVLVNNSKGAVVHDIYGGNAKSLVSEYYTTEAGVFYDQAKPNIFYDIHANNCDYAVSLRSKFSIWRDVTQSNCTYHVYFGTSNAQSCQVKFLPDSIAYGGSQTPALYLNNNRVEGRRLKRMYFQPLQYLVSDYASVRAGDSPISKAVYTAADKPLTFIFPIPDDAYAINDFRMFFRWGAGAQTKGSSIVVSLVAMQTFDGNTSLEPVTLLSTTRTPTADTAAEVTLVLQAAATTPGYIPIDGPEVTGYLPRAAQLVIQVLNPVDNIVLKECSLQYYGNIK